MNASDHTDTVGRGQDLPASGRKTRITIRIDTEIIGWFKRRVEALGGGNYQTLLNQALRDYIGKQTEPLEKTLRRVLREELHSTQPVRIKPIRIQPIREKEPEPVVPVAPPALSPGPQAPKRWETEQAWGG